MSASDREAADAAADAPSLDAGRISAALAEAVSAVVDIEVLAEAGSSNDVLLGRAAPALGRMSVCVVERQSSGRGRRGRRWSSVPGGALTMSIGYRFERAQKQSPALSLVVAVAVGRALSRATNVDIGFKWPNDLVVDGRKLGGILLEARADADSLYAVAGIGVNVEMDPVLLRTVSDWPGGAVDIATATGRRGHDRNSLAAALVRELHAAFERFRAEGFAPFRQAWESAHVMAGAPGRLSRRGSSIDGIVRGIDADGALLFEHERDVIRVLDGEVSLRSAG